MKAKRIFPSSFLVLAFYLTGCSVKIVNTTPDIAPASPTGNYTLSAHAQVKRKTVVPSSLEAFVVINGEQRAMTATTVLRLWATCSRLGLRGQMSPIFKCLYCLDQTLDENP